MIWILPTIRSLSIDASFTQYYRQPAFRGPVDLFVVYLTTIAVAQIIWRWITRQWIVKGEKENCHGLSWGASSEFDWRD